MAIDELLKYECSAFMSLIANQYRYLFEIESVLHQVIAVLDNAVVRRYDKNEETGEREIVNSIKPIYKMGLKSRVSLSLVNKAKNYTLPLIAINVKSIRGMNERIAAPHNILNDFNKKQQELYSYERPTPIEIALEVKIYAQYLTDLYQIFGKLGTQFRPYFFFSWFVPKNKDVDSFEELRNKIEWDWNMNLDAKDELRETDEELYTATLNFNVQAWLFPRGKYYNDSMIRDIGSTILVDSDVESRIEAFGEVYRPLVSQAIKELPSYNNPREFANVRPRIINAYNLATTNGNEETYFLMKSNRFIHFNRNVRLELNGYNFDENTKLLLVPQDKRSEMTIKKNFELYDVVYDESANLFPLRNTNEQKSLEISGYLVPSTLISPNRIRLNLSDTKISGRFDVIVFNKFDYDSLKDEIGLPILINTFK